MDTLRLRVKFKDRVGIVLDVSKLVSPKNINIVSLQVLPNEMYLEIEAIPEKDFIFLQQELVRIPGVTGVTPIEMMPHEEKERKTRAVLDSTSEGIIAVDKQGIITTFNPACEKILRLKAEEAVGRHVSKIISADAPLLTSLQTGQGYDNREIILSTTRGRHHYISSGRVILDDLGRTIGVVASMKGMSEVRDLVYSITRPSMITFDDIIYESEALAQVVNLARRVARSNSTVMIRGESGTGKELFARAIHMDSTRRDKPFVPLNCAALPESLLESELFGYSDGAFTGAKRGGKQGLFEFASGGTLFLDEIGELSPHLQAKLLRVLQEGTVRRIGERMEIPVDVRVITATNRYLEEMMARGDFREDLYYRLNVFPITLPPLRERPDDIPFIARHLLHKFSRRLGRGTVNISPEAMDRLKEHSWPGNVRELENVIERAMNLLEGGEIQTAHIIFDHQRVSLPDYSDKFDPAQYPPPAKTLTSGQNLKVAASAAEREILLTALKTHGSARRAAQALGVSHTTILNKMKKYGISLK